MKRLLAKLGFIKLVWLKDCDGEVNLAIKRKNDPFTGKDWAYRYYTTKRRVILEEGGRCSGIIYVEKWKDY